MLEPEQEELLAKLVEAGRNVPREQRQFFVVAYLGTGEVIEGVSLSEPIPATSYDVGFLIRQGLLYATNYGRGSITFVVTPEGNAFYERYKQHAGAPAIQLEEDVRQYFDSDRFKARYPQTHRLWSTAAESIWAADSVSQLTTIGHQVREAMQMFATELVERYQVTDTNPDPTKTLDRISVVIKQKAQAGANANLLDALFGYWRALNGIVQRQEHGSQKGGEQLTTEDARRVIFHAISTMTEIDRTL